MTETRVDIVARKMGKSGDLDAQAKEMCPTDDEKCIRMAKALLEIKELNEKNKKFHAYEKYTYPKVKKILKEVEFDE